jgi:peptidoglycan/xylan/chitin deacetylase (PgdA/CDA1 family)
MLKQTVLNLMRVTGTFTPFRLANRSKTLVLTYHRFSERESEYKTSARAFADHLEYLTQHYSLLPLSHIVDSVATGKTLPLGAAAITIDDGYRDFYDIAYPLLLKYRVPATLFVATDFVDQKGWLWTDKMRYLMAHTPLTEFDFQLKGRTIRAALTDARSRRIVADKVTALLKTMPNEFKEETLKRLAALVGVVLPAVPPAEYGAITWKQAREMDREGIEIGSHTATHPILPHVSDEQLQTELETSKARLEAELGREMTLFCYPNGRYDMRVQQATALAGYRCAVSNQPGLNTMHTPLLALRRISAEPDLAHFVQSTSGFELVKERLRGNLKLDELPLHTTMANARQMLAE